MSTKQRLKRLAAKTLTAAVPLVIGATAGHYIGRKRENKKVVALKDDIDFWKQQTAREAEHVQVLERGITRKNKEAKAWKAALDENKLQTDYIMQELDIMNVRHDALVGSTEQRVQAARAEGMFEGSRLGYEDGRRSRTAEVNYYRSRARNVPDYDDSTLRNAIGEPPRRRGGSRIKKVAKKVLMTGVPLAATAIVAHQLGAMSGYNEGYVNGHKYASFTHTNDKLAKMHLLELEKAKEVEAAHKRGFQEGHDMGRTANLVHIAQNPGYWTQLDPNHGWLDRRPRVAHGLKRRHRGKGLFTEAPDPGTGYYGNSAYSTDTRKPSLTDVALTMWNGYNAYKRHQRRQKAREAMAKQMGVDPDDLEDDE